MNVTSSGIIDGIIQPQYGSHGTQFNENNIPTFSLPFKVENAPKETVSLAIVLEDKDAYPITGGFVWIHWLAATVSVTPTPEPPTSNPLLETMGISYDDGTTDGLATSDAACTNTGLPYGPVPLPKETAPGKVIPMPRRKVI